MFDEKSRYFADLTSASGLITGILQFIVAAEPVPLPALVKSPSSLLCHCEYF
jgi:hypothetical protein